MRPRGTIAPVRHGPLNYESKGTAQPARFTADVVVLCLALAYATVNVVFMLKLARGRLDRLPLELIGAFWVVSSVGTMTAFPICLALRRCGITWRSGLGATLTFAALTLFNVWCIFFGLRGV